MNDTIISYVRQKPSIYNFLRSLLGPLTLTPLRENESYLQSIHIMDTTLNVLMAFSVAVLFSCLRITTIFIISFYFPIAFVAIVSLHFTFILSTTRFRNCGYIFIIT